jgi:hypothetical protein
LFIAVAMAAEEVFRAGTLKSKLISITVLTWFGIAVIVNIIATTVYVIRGGDAAHWRGTL